MKKHTFRFFYTPTFVVAGMRVRSGIVGENVQNDRRWVFNMAFCKFGGGIFGRIKINLYFCEINLHRSGFPDSFPLTIYFHR